ncbi:MAG: hypothetical protein AB7U49_11570 [Hyphomicrobiaceae bacterium]
MGKGRTSSAVAPALAVAQRVSAGVRQVRGQFPARQLAVVRAQPVQQTGAGLADVCLLLRRVREGERLDEVALAWFLEVPLDTVRALESGSLAVLPPWPETERTVRRWLGLAGLDPAPSLSELKAAVSAHGGRTRAAATDAGAMADVTPVERRRPASRMAVALANRRMPSRPARWAIGGLVLLVAAWGIGRETLVVAGAVGETPPARGIVQRVSDYLAITFAPTQAGHRWIDVANPRTRRTDKLQAAVQSD